MGSRDAEAMPSRSGDYDAGGMVWGSMIGKKLLAGGGLPSGWASLLAVPLGLGGPHARSCAGGGGRSGQRRGDA